MLLQFDLQSDEVVDRVEPQEITVCAAHKDVFLNLLRLEVAH